jgi:hypothetical protein
MSGPGTGLLRRSLRAGPGLRQQLYIRAGRSACNQGKRRGFLTVSTTPICRHYGIALRPLASLPWPPPVLLQAFLLILSPKLVFLATWQKLRRSRAQLLGRMSTPIVCLEAELQPNYHEGPRPKSSSRSAARSLVALLLSFSRSIQRILVQFGGKATLARREMIS